ncbi:hypothetical protein CEE36_02055 [candidate division TA06 bacterium B3_TA06]|uniref:FlgD/Vpr Ig-like domain-containing protein n=1 Tax=candidate division TA06 bacterium B3_TA06 TaxID=2012487 RepID=A0A532V9N7_UNCT6|nr:MAG: hypothetical protein CEE36_02055 [candidate division TA06 bacterium B3_TA06]
MKLQCFVLSVLSLYGLAFGNVWSEPESLVPFNTHNEDPAVIIDNSGVAWALALPWVLRFQNGETGWQKMTEGGIGGISGMDRGCFDKGDTLWLLNDNDWQIYYIRWDGESWSEKEYVLTYSSCNFGSKITADSTNGVWAAWSTEWWGFFKGAYNRYQNGVWQEPQPVTDTLEEGDHVLNSITTDAYGRVWFGWSQSQGGKMVFETRYYDNGNWSEVSSIAESKWLVRLKLTPDRKGGVWALWNQQDGGLHTDYLIKASYWNGDAWTSPETVAVAGAFYNDWFPCGKIAVDAYGNAWAVWRQALEDNDKYGDIYYSVNTGEGWSEPAPVDTHPAVDQYPDIAVDGEGRIWCVWSSNREGEDEWDYSIWASYATVVGVKEPVTPVTHHLPSLTIDKSVGGEFTFSVSHSNIVRGIVIYDASGRVIRDLTISDNQTIHWDGTDAKGQALSPGVYFVKLSPASSTLKLILIR